MRDRQNVRWEEEPKNEKNVRGKKTIKRKQEGERERM